MFRRGQRLCANMCEFARTVPDRLVDRANSRVVTAMLCCEIVSMEVTNAVQWRQIKLMFHDNGDFDILFMFYLCQTIALSRLNFRVGSVAEVVKNFVNCRMNRNA